MTSPTVVTLMAAALQRELFARGVKAFPLFDCEAIISVVLEKSAKAGDTAPTRAQAEDLIRRST
jgi:hypothetical protein